MEVRPLACWQVGGTTKIAAAAQAPDGRQWLVLDAAGALKLVAYPAGAILVDAVKCISGRRIQVSVVPLYCASHALLLLQVPTESLAAEQPEAVCEAHTVMQFPGGGITALAALPCMHCLVVAATDKSVRACDYRCVDSIGVEAIIRAGCMTPKTMML